MQTCFTKTNVFLGHKKGAELNGQKRHWTELNETERNWTKMNETERNWTNLNEMERNWTELDRTELNFVSKLTEMERNTKYLALTSFPIIYTQHES